MILYLDSSAAVKLFVEETESTTVQRWAAEADGVATSRVAYVEVCAALARRRRERRLTEERFTDALAALKDQWKNFAAIEVDEFWAGELAVKHGLRGFDAVHLAAALELRESVSVPVFFSSYDKLQLDAALAENLSIAA